MRTARKRKQPLKNSFIYVIVEFLKRKVLSMNFSQIRLIGRKKKSVITDLVKALKKDEGYYITWKANIAMAFFDATLRKTNRISRKLLHEVANEAADNFIQMLMK
jgi:hypothetical protein